MISLYLIRHGECEGRGTYIGRGSDVPLDEKGVQQIAEMAESFGSESFKSGIILTSPMKRALQSSHILSEVLNCPYRIVPGLEESDFGNWEGKSYDQIASTEENEILRNWISDPFENSPPGGESLSELESRVLRAVNFINPLIADKNKNEIMIVSHRGPLVLLLLNYLGIEPDKFWNFRMDRGSVSRLELYPRFAELVYLNLTAVP
ncbi:histidine phosphatase family protein [Spirochaeta isovalerica]|uniref:Putative phosphoglycerate mutase n=1 Tax=Spirochaeta isovalerica TaxID=150 RepID=A0A841R8L3_9SPIO|nr:histidine phosphatase family protein [Spirochaeta isovalerica]MBB6479068.1 putative phosphoglycerate mutase [Spirochaeta isovalerica]